MVYHVEIGGPAHLYLQDVPAGAMAVGVIRDDDGAAGALLRFRTGAYARMNDGAVRALDRLKVLRAMAAALDSPPEPGRP
jgi:hypothetical protein